VDPRAGLDNVEKILDPTETRIPIPRSSSPQPVAIPTMYSQKSIICIYIYIQYESIGPVLVTYVSLCR
jgi:hypothetical protein